MREQQLAHLSAQGGLLPFHLRTELTHEMLGLEQDVLAPLAERRQMNPVSDALSVVGDNGRAPDLRIVVGDGHRREPQAGEGGQPTGRMNGDPPADLTREGRGGNVGRCPAEHQESSVTFACNALDTREDAAVVLTAQDFHHRSDREIAHGPLSASAQGDGIRHHRSFGRDRSSA